MMVASFLPCLILLVCYLPPGLPQGRPSSGVRLYSYLEDEVLPNNTILSPEDIGTSVNQAILCETARDENDHGGTWYDPTGEELPDGASGNVLFSSTNFGGVSFRRGSVEFDSAGVEGVYRCQIRDENGIFQTLYAGIYRTNSYQNSNGPVVLETISFTLLTDLSSSPPSYSLNCTTQSFPPTEVSWSRDGQPLPLSGETYQSSQQLRDALSTTYDNFLTVNGSLPGLYNCMATNERGSQSTMLDVIIPSGPPTNLRATIQGMNQVRVSWTAPDNVLGYLIFHQLDGGSESQVNVEDPGATEHTIELTGEGQHTISMLAYGHLPNTTRSEPVNVTLNFPDMPTVTRVSHIDRLTVLSVSWTPSPQDDGLEGFRISYIPISDCPSIPGGIREVEGGGVTELTVEDLVGDTQYNVTVSARNDVGYGPPSTGVLGTTSRVAPSGPPLSVVPTAVDPNTIRVTWDPPACDTWNSDAITNYFIKYNGQNPLQVGGDVRTFPISNLPTFAMYTVVMRAANSEGLGPFSAARTVTLVDVPGPVLSLSSSPDILSVTVRWQPPLGAGGFITSYNVSHRLTTSGAEEPFLGTAEVGGGATSHRVTGLVPETQYTIVVEAFTSAGGGRTISVFGTTTDVGQVQDVAVRSLNASAVNVSWSRTSEDISHFKVYFSPEGGRSRRQGPTSPVQFPGSTSWGVVGMLQNGAEYQFQVSAVIMFPGVVREGLRSQTATVGSTSSSSDSNAAAIAGGIIGALIFVLLVILAVIFIYVVWNRRGKSGKFTISNSIELKPRPTPLPLPDFDTKPGSDIPSSRPIIEDYPRDSISIEGERVVFNPKFSGSPFPSIAWYHDGYMVVSDYSINLEDSGKLTIVSVEPRHAGNYRFTVSNSSGSVQGQVNLFVRSDTDDTPLTQQGAPQVKSVPVDVANFGAYVAEKHSNNNRGFRDQFLCLDPEAEEAGREWMIASLPDNRARNRFKNITPFDDNRIVLKAIGNRPDCQHDYINASYIDGYYIPKKFVASQGPLPGTMVDFWRMVSQLHCPSIVMITNVQEGSKVKCEQYWPDSVSKTLEFGPFKVTLTDQHVLADYTIRNLLLSLTTKSHAPIPVTQYHFTAWPDHGVPDYATSMINFHRRVKSSHKPGKGPMLIHCSAGVGRTGTFITLDVALEQASTEDQVDVPSIIAKTRRQRMKMVQTLDQYVFIHDAVLEALMCGDTQIPSSKLQTTIDYLAQSNPRTQLTGYESQFNVLNQVTPKPEESACTSATRFPHKNRFSSYLPTDRWRVVLKAEQPDYIHASFANGYKQKKAYIIAQGPLENTCRDFWKMIYERDCCAIVMLSGVAEGGQEVCHRYWPAYGMEQYGEFTVCSMQETKHDGFVERIFSVTDSKSGQVHRVTQFQVLDWGPDGLSATPAAIIGSISCVMNVQRRSGNTPIVIHCSDTVGRSGIFCCVTTAIEACKTESIMDIFQVVKALRIQKPGAVPTVEQYHFIHSLVLVFLENFANYSNFK